MTRSVVVSALAAVLVMPLSLRATTVIAPTFDELVRAAEVVFRGEVIDTRSRLVATPDGETIVTDVYFNVERVLKGKTGATLVLQFLGGKVGDRRYQIEGMPTFLVGDRDVLFATPSQQLACPLVAMMYGRVRIVTDPGTKESLVRRFDGAPVREASAVTFRASQPALSPNASMSAAAFERAVMLEVVRQTAGGVR